MRGVPVNTPRESDLLRLLQGLRVKGRCDAGRVANARAMDAPLAAESLERLRAEGLVEEKGGLFAISEAGESRRSQLLEAERAQLDHDAMENLYAEFCAIDPAFKQLVADVQLGTIERGDAAAHVGPLHQRLQALLARAGALLPRLEPYTERFREALEALAQGDPRYLASPRVESYHGIWFEFHEELIQASGRTRADAAAAEPEG